MNPDELSPGQREVVDATEQTVLVTGGAGTGKTTVALWAARSELERPGNEKKHALFLTFSRTAVDQIISRSRVVVAPVEDRIEVSTFHSFAYRLVRRFGYQAGLTARNPAVQSASEAKLLGKASDRLVYDDLAPLARKILDDLASRHSSRGAGALLSATSSKTQEITNGRFSNGLAGKPGYCSWETNTS